MEEKEVSDLMAGYQKVLKLFTEHLQHCSRLKQEVSDVEEFKEIE